MNVNLCESLVQVFVIFFGDFMEAVRGNRKSPKHTKNSQNFQVYFYHKASRTSVKKLTDVVEENAALASKELAAALTQNPPKEGEKTATTPFSPAPVAFDAAFTTIFDELNTRAPPTKKKK